jgi:hypothetical protein
LPALTNDQLNTVLEVVVIQRSRATVKALAAAQNRTVYFPHRSAPEGIEIAIGPESERYRQLINLADQLFRPGMQLLRKLHEDFEKASKNNKPFGTVKMPRNLPQGIKMAAFLTEQYRREPTNESELYQDEVHLAGLVFANALKQLESSPVAFQSILQNLGLGLLARLHTVFGETAEPIARLHGDWTRAPLFTNEGQQEESEDDVDLESDGDAIDVSGEEPDTWLNAAVQARGLRRKLRDFREETHDTSRWRADIETLLQHLRRIHEATVEARKQPDPKLAAVLPKIIERTRHGRKVLLFTQSRRTA